MVTRNSIIIGHICCTEFFLKNDEDAVAHLHTCANARETIGTFGKIKFRIHQNCRYSALYWYLNIKHLNKCRNFFSAGLSTKSYDAARSNNIIECDRTRSIELLATSGRFRSRGNRVCGPQTIKARQWENTRTAKVERRIQTRSRNKILFEIKIYCRCVKRRRGNESADRDRKR